MIFIKSRYDLFLNNNMEKMPLVSIIIVNYNGKSLLEECLATLMKIDYKNYEIILVDNNSTDTSVEYVKNTYPSITIIKLNDNYGFAEPNNIGAKNTKGEFLLFLNNDTKVSPNFIGEMVKEFEHDPNIAICQSLLLKPNGDIDSSGDFIDNIGRAYSSRIKENEVKKILCARGASMMIRKDAFVDLGGFDKNFFASFEDVDLGWRAWIWGYKVVLVPKSIVYHKGGQTTKYISSKIRFHGVKNVLILHLANFEGYRAITTPLKLFTMYFLRKFFKITVFPDHEGEKKVFPSVGKTLQSICWVLKNLNYVLAKHKKVNSKRICSTKDLIKQGLITKC